MTPFYALRVQRFDNLYNPTPSATLSLADVLDAIMDGMYAAAIQALRMVFQHQGEDAYRTAKQRLPQVTFAGTFAPTRAKEHLVQHSEGCHADIDHLVDLAETKARLQEDPHILYIFTSPRGDGLKYGVRVAKVATDEAYKHTWRILANAHKAAYGVVWDPSGKDICRLCFVSWDPACYINPDAEAYPVPPPMATPPPTSACPRPVTRFADDHRTRFAQRAITAAVRMIAEAPRGQQHYARLRAARLLGGYVAGGLLTETEAKKALQPPTEAQAKDMRAAMKTIADGLAYGEAMPITFDELEAEYQAWQARRRPSLSHRTLTPTAPHRQLATQPQGRTLAGEDTHS
jgi:hypothetical protein